MPLRAACAIGLRVSEAAWHRQRLLHHYVDLPFGTGFRPPPGDRDVAGKRHRPPPVFVACSIASRVSGKTSRGQIEALPVQPAVQGSASGSEMPTSSTSLRLIRFRRNPVGVTVHKPGNRSRSGRSSWRCGTSSHRDETSAAYLHWLSSLWVKYARYFFDFGSMQPDKFRSSTFLNSIGWLSD